MYICMHQYDVDTFIKKILALFHKRGFKFQLIWSFIDILSNIYTCLLTVNAKFILVGFKFSRDKIIFQLVKFKLGFIEFGTSC